MWRVFPHRSSNRPIRSGADEGRGPRRAWSKPGLASLGRGWRAGPLGPRSRGPRQPHLRSTGTENPINSFCLSPPPLIWIIASQLIVSGRQTFDPHCLVFGKRERGRLRLWVGGSELQWGWWAGGREGGKDHYRLFFSRGAWTAMCVRTESRQTGAEEGGEVSSRTLSGAQTLSSRGAAELSGPPAGPTLLRTPPAKDGSGQGSSPRCPGAGMVLAPPTDAGSCP